MISVKVDVKIDAAKFAQRADRAKEVLANEAMKDTDQFVPALTGSLAGRARVQGDTIVYPGPYARFLWEGKVLVDPDTGSPWARPGATKVANGKSLVFTKAMHGQAQSHWFDASKAMNLPNWVKKYKEAILNGR